jgi:hypothetical protein
VRQSKDERARTITAMLKRFGRMVRSLISLMTVHARARQDGDDVIPY